MNRARLTLAQVDRHQHRTANRSGKHRLQRVRRRHSGIGAGLVAWSDDTTVVAIAVALANLSKVLGNGVVERRTNGARRTARQFVAWCAEVEIDPRQEQRTQNGHGMLQPGKPPMAHVASIIPKKSGLPSRNLSLVVVSPPRPSRNGEPSHPRPHGTGGTTYTPSNSPEQAPTQARSRPDCRKALRATP